MLTFRRILSSVGLTLLLSAAASSLHAQIVIGPNGPLPPKTNTQISFSGGYTGTVTQTTATGLVTTGTFTLNTASALADDPYAFKDIDSRLIASITLNGVTTEYAGRLALNSQGVRTVPGIAYLRPVVTGTSQPVTAAAKIPIFVNASLAYGGIQDEAGTSLTFRASKVTGAISIGDGSAKQPH